MRHNAQRLNAQPAGGHRPASADVDGPVVFKRFIKYCEGVPGGINQSKYLSGWFKGADMSSIRRGNLEAFIAYGFCYTTREAFEAEGRGQLLKEMVDDLERVGGQQAPPGFNPDIQFMGHLWEPLKAGHRLLAFYLCTEAIAYCSRRLLRRWGFKHHRHAGISYHTLDLESANHTAVSTQPCQSPSTAPKPAPQQDANNTSSLTTVHDQDLSPFGAASAAQLGGVTAASNSQQGGLSGQVPAEAAAERRPSKEQLPSWQKQHSLQTIMEQQKSGDSCYSAQAQPASTGTPAAELEVFESPFASADSNNYSGELTASTLNNGSLAYKAGGVVTANGATAAEASCAKTHSLPVAQGSKAEAGGMQQLQQQASCSVPRPGLARKTSLLLSQKPSILQAALTGVLSFDGGADDINTPVVFLHGIGGLPAYLELLLHLIAGGHPLLAVELKSVAMRLGRVYSVGEVAEAVLGMMDKTGVKEACFVAHSYGTFIASYLAKHHPQRVKGCVLVDPVCMGMFMPNLTYNFLYKEPLSWQGWGKAGLTAYIRSWVRYCVSSELHVRASLARRFYWTEMNAWPEDLPRGSTILLSGKDDLMDSPEVNVMLQGADHVKVIYNSELAHGAFLLDAEVKQAIKDSLKSLLATSGSAVVGLAQQLSTLVQPGAAAAAAAAGSVLPATASSALQYVLRQVHSMHPEMGPGRMDDSVLGVAADGSDPVRRSMSDGPRSHSIGQGKAGQGAAAASVAEAKGAQLGLAGDAGCDVGAHSSSDQAQQQTKKLQ